MKAGTSVIFLPCRDIEKTRHFYHEILGLSIEQKQGENLYIFDTGASKGTGIFSMILMCLANVMNMIREKQEKKKEEKTDEK